MDNQTTKDSGQIKITNYVSSLKRNEGFLKDLDNLKDLRDKKLNYTNKRIKKMENLEEQLIELDIEFKTLQEKHRKILFLGLDEAIQNFCIKYKLSPDIIYLLIEHGTIEKNGIDLCRIVDNYEKLTKDRFDCLTQIDLDKNIHSHAHSYPINIEIHQYTTKRDMIDFISKNWKEIEAILSKYRGRPKRFRRRKHSNELLDFIWENKDKGAREIAELSNKNFEEASLIYSDIYDILKSEKLRRLKNIS